MNTPKFNAPRVEGQHDVNHRTLGRGRGTTGSGTDLIKGGPVPPAHDRAHGKHRAENGGVSVWVLRMPLASERPAVTS